MPYDLITIQATIERTLGIRVSRARLQEELERPTWVPETGRMIAVADSLDDLPASNRYGMFEGMSPKNQYMISTGRYKYARVLTVDEIAQCY